MKEKITVTGEQTMTCGHASIFSKQITNKSMFFQISFLISIIFYQEFVCKLYAVFLKWMNFDIWETKEN